MFPPFPLPEKRPPPEGCAPSIRKAEANDRDVAAFARHLSAHMEESGHDGVPHFALTRRLSVDDVRAAALSRWSKRLDEPLWGRAFLLCAGDEVVGHLELRGGRIPAEMHRAVLGMGIGRDHTGQGHGRRLIEAAVGWAQEETGLAWIDLGVFATNERAYRLYRRMGFVEQGMREDAYRIDAGLVVTDVLMALDLRGYPRQKY